MNSTDKFLPEIDRITFHHINVLSLLNNLSMSTDPCARDVTEISSGILAQSALNTQVNNMGEALYENSRSTFKSSERVHSAVSLLVALSIVKWPAYSIFSRVLELCNSGSTLELPELWGLGWNIGFSLYAAPLLSFWFCILEMSKEGQEKTREMMRSYSSWYSS